MSHLLIGIALFVTSAASAVNGQDQLVAPEPARPPVEKLGDGTYRVGPIRVDTTKRELSVTGSVNDVTILEFVANTKNGQKAYESAITIDTDAITFNAALLLLGLDPKRAVVPTRHFDPTPPEGDPIDIFVDAVIRTPLAPQVTRRLRVEELLFDKRTGKTLAEGPWVYTGSGFVEDLNGRRYLADLDGVLIGFVHSPAPVIENPRAGAVDGYGSVVLNSNLGLSAGSPITLVIKALPRSPKDRR